MKNPIQAYGNFDPIRSDSATQTDSIHVDDLDAIEAEKIKKTKEIATRVFENSPSLAWECLKAGLAKEKVSNDQLSNHIKQADSYQKTIDLLLELSSEFTALPDNASHELSEKTLATLNQLKEKGIDIWRGEGTTITKEKMVEVKSLITSFIDKNRTDLQTLFTTKIQVLIQNISSITEVLKNINREDAALKRTIVGHFAK
jgi:hypothetical protein